MLDCSSKYRLVVFGDKHFYSTLKSLAKFRRVSAAVRGLTLVIRVLCRRDEQVKSDFGVEQV